MNEYRAQRLKEDLTFAQQRNKRQRQQLANYKKVHEKDLKEIERLNNIIKEVREYIEKNWISQKDADNYRFDDEELDIEISDIAVLYDILDKESDKE